MFVLVFVDFPLNFWLNPQHVHFAGIAHLSCFHGTRGRNAVDSDYTTGHRSLIFSTFEHLIISIFEWTLMIFLRFTRQELQEHSTNHSSMLGPTPGPAVDRWRVIGRLSDVTAAAMCYANQEPVMDSISTPNNVESVETVGAGKIWPGKGTVNIVMLVTFPVNYWLNG